MISFSRIRNAFLYKVLLRFPYSKVRIFALRKLGSSVGSQVYFPSDITITMNFVEQPYKLLLGNRVSIAPKCTFILMSHPNSSRIRRLAPQHNGDIIIEDDAWIGAGAIVLPGIRVGGGR